MTQAHAYPNDHDSGGDGHGHEPHVLPISTYLAVWAALVVFTVITVAISRFDFGAANTVIAMLVATVKASLVVLFFMHLYYDNKFNLVILIASLLFVSIFFTPVLIDLGTRGALDAVKTRAGYQLANTPPSLEPAAPATPAAGEAGQQVSPTAPPAGGATREAPAVGAPGSVHLPPPATQGGQPAAPPAQPLPVPAHH